MRHGASWYQREPLAYLGGVQGLPMRLHAVYSVVIDLCYAHGGSINNDPKWISGWFSDMGSASVRKSIAELVALGKLMIDDDGSLTQKRAKNEAKTREKLRENAEKTGRKGGINSGKSRAAAKEINTLSEGSASPKTKQIRLDKIREDKKEVGSYEPTARERAMCARDHLEPIIGEELAKAFVAHRVALKAPMTPHAGKLMASKLAAMPDPAAAVTLSLERGWKGVFQPEPAQVHPFPGKSRRQTDGERLDHHLDALKARLAVQRLE